MGPRGWEGERRRIEQQYKVGRAGKLGTEGEGRRGCRPLRRRDGKAEGVGDTDQ